LSSRRRMVYNQPECRSRIKDPFDQAVTNKHRLYRYLKEECQDFPRFVTMGHFVVFLRLNVTGDSGQVGPVKSSSTLRI